MYLHEAASTKQTQDVDQRAIDQILAVTNYILFHKPARLDYPLENGQVLRLVDPYGVYAQAKVVIDLIERIPANEHSPTPTFQRAASYAVYENTVTNHPGAFSAHSKSEFLPVTNDELDHLLGLLCQVMK